MAQRIVIVAMLCLVILAGVLVLVFSQGSCPNTSSCLPISECYDRHQETNSLNSTLLFSCSDRTGSVCCPAVPNSPVGPYMTTNDLESQKKLLPMDVCGYDSGHRISGGQAAGLGQFPWMALLSFEINGSSGVRDFLCGGTLISRNYILTAAHCLTTKNGLPLQVRLGEHNLISNPDCSADHCAREPVDIDVEKVIPHQSYNTPFLKNDIALLRLKTSVNLTDYVRPICLPFGLNITGMEEQRYQIAGWGKEETSSTKGSSELLFANVHSVPVDECDVLQIIEKLRPIADQQLCAGGGSGQDACKGDSGGPLMDLVLDETGQARTYQLGIVSFSGTVACATQIPSVYTRVSAYLNWILSKLEP